MRSSFLSVVIAGSPQRSPERSTRSYPVDATLIRRQAQREYRRWAVCDACGWVRRIRALGDELPDASLASKGPSMYVVLIIVVVLAVPAILYMRLAAAKRREQRVGSPSTYTRPTDP